MTTSIEYRVRAILTAPGGLLVIRRVRPGAAAYCVFPGGGVEPSDATLPAALLREIREEIGGTPRIGSPVWLIERELTADSVRTIQREVFFLASIDSWRDSDRSGAELADATRGTYETVVLPLDGERLRDANLVPEEVTRLIVRQVEASRPLDELPALSESDFS